MLVVGMVFRGVYGGRAKVRRGQDFREWGRGGSFGRGKGWWWGMGSGYLGYDVECGSWVWVCGGKDGGGASIWGME